MNNINTGGPAFPVPMFSIGHAKYEAQQQGLTLRDYFAAKAMQGLVAGADTEHGINLPGTAEWSYKMADAMLRAREVQHD